MNASYGLEHIQQSRDFWKEECDRQLTTLGQLVDERNAAREDAWLWQENAKRLNSEYVQAKNGRIDREASHEQLMLSLKGELEAAVEEKDRLKMYLKSANQRENGYKSELSRLNNLIETLKAAATKVALSPSEAFLMRDQLEAQERKIKRLLKAEKERDLYREALQGLNNALAVSSEIDL
jgi:hypothetical protein